MANYALVAGVPAKRIGWVSRTGDRLDADRIFPRTGEQYVKTNGTRRPEHNLKAARGSVGYRAL